MPSDDVDDSKVVEDVHVPSKTASIIEDIAVDFDILIIEKIHMSSDSISDDVNKIVESSTPALPSKLIEFPCDEYNFMVVTTESYSSESPEFIVMIKQMVSSTSSFTNHLEFIPESSLSLAEFVCVILGITYLSFSLVRNYT